MRFATVCVLSYQRPPFLSDTLRSLLGGAGLPIELIIHDDGSSDPGVKDVLREYSDRATIITNPPGWNQGQGVALNRMFRMAKGDPIVKMDQDLILEKGWLADACKLLDANPTLGLLGLCHYHHDPVDMRKSPPLLTRHQDWQQHTHILGSAFAVSRKCWEALGPFEEYSDAFAEDWTFQKRVTDSQQFVCGLPDRQLARNDHMGIGPSTIVYGDPRHPSVTKIHHSPRIIEP